LATRIYDAAAIIFHQGYENLNNKELENEIKQIRSKEQNGNIN